MPVIYSTRRVKRLTLYLSEHDRFGNSVQDIAYWRAEAYLVLSNLSGTGATQLPGLGVSADVQTGQLQEEPVTLLYADVVPTVFESRKDELLAFMERFGLTTGQRAVYAEYDGEAHYLEIQREARPQSKEA